MSERISNELRRGGKAAIIARPGFRDRAVRTAGHRSLSAEMISAMSDAAAAASATRDRDINVCLLLLVAGPDIAALSADHGLSLIAPQDDRKAALTTQRPATQAGTLREP